METRSLERTIKEKRAKSECYEEEEKIKLNILRKNIIFLVHFVEKAWAVIPSSTSFANVECISDAVASKVEQSRMICVHVRFGANLKTHTEESRCRF